MTQGLSDAGLVQLKSAVKRFTTPEGGNVTALDRVDLSVGGNEFVTLLGPSGCGKTTLLRCISGFEDLDEGSLVIDGRPMAGVPAYRRPVNTVFQNYALFPHMTVGTNVGYSLEVAGVARGERRRRVDEVLDLVNLQGMQQRRPAQLSGGQQQRVALARAIINRPRILLLDEPLSALDRKLRQAMQLELKNLQHELGISFVFVTHDQEEALTMSDRIVVMDSGRVQQIGTPTEIYHRPQTVFVAQFIGESNLFEARVDSTDNTGSRFVTADGLAFFSSARCDLNTGEQVSLLLRPENFELAGSSDDETVHPHYHPHYRALQGTLLQEVFLGSDYHLLVQAGENTTIKVTVRDAARERLSDLQPGSAITLQYPLQRLHVLTA